MANTINPGAIAGQATINRRGGTRFFAVLAAVALVLILAAGAIALQLRAATAPETPAATGYPVASDPITADTGFVPNQFTYREDHRAVLPAEASTTEQYRWDFPGVAVAPASDAPVSIPGPWRGICRAGSSDCLPELEIPAGTPDWEQQERTQVAPGLVSFQPGGDRSRLR